MADLTSLITTDSEGRNTEMRCCSVRCLERSCRGIQRVKDRQYRRKKERANEGKVEKTAENHESKKANKQASKIETHQSRQESDVQIGRGIGQFDTVGVRLGGFEELFDLRGPLSGFHRARLQLAHTETHEGRLESAHRHHHHAGVGGRDAGLLTARSPLGLQLRPRDYRAALGVKTNVPHHTGGRGQEFLCNPQHHTKTCQDNVNLAKHTTMY